MGQEAIGHSVGSPGGKRCGSEMHHETKTIQTDRLQVGNPFAALTETDSSASATYPTGGKPVTRRRLAVSGAFWTILLAFPISALLALLFRFPVPFVGYMSGPSAVVPAMFTILLYGLPLGGFVCLGLVGAIAGLWIPDSTREHRRKAFWSIRLWSTGVATASMIVLSILDKIIGPF